VTSKLEQMSIHEVSAVEDGANEIPGWMVLKSKQGDGLLTQIHKAAEAYTREHGGDDRAIAREMIIKAAEQLPERHITRHPESGRFTANPAMPAGGMPGSGSLFVHSGNVLPALRG
jgi:hypothetical protein